MSDYKIVETEKLDADLASVADAIREKGGTSESLTFPQGFVDAVGAIESGGGEAEATLAEIETMITESGLDVTGESVTEKVEGLIDETLIFFTQARRISFATNTKIEEITLDCQYYNRLTEFAYNCTSVTRINLSNTQNVDSWQRAFSGCPKLKTLRKLDCSGVISSGFTNAFPCPVLEEFEVVPETIKYSVAISSAVLTDESIQSIFDGLNSEVTGQTLTLSLKAVKKAFETSKGANDGDASETWNALVASKPNWTITLS